MNRNEFHKSVFTTALFVSWHTALARNAGSIESISTDDLPEPLRGLILKNFPKGWEKALYEKGERRWRSGDQLKWIGMPIGGLYAGHVHLGGDGRLWHWDIFNEHKTTWGKEYKDPTDPDEKRSRFGCENLDNVNQGFALKWKSGTDEGIHDLDKRGFPDIEFLGEYPVGFMKYRDPALPVAVDLTAFSPFVPLQVEDSDFPATVMEYTVTNTSSEQVDVELGGWLGNHALIDTGAPDGLMLRENSVKSDNGIMSLYCHTVPQVTETSKRQDVVIDLFNGKLFKDWSITGTAFGEGPLEKWRAQKLVYGDLNCPYNRVAASLQTKWHDADKNATGRMLSKAVKVERDYIGFWIGGGNAAGKTCLNLLVDGNVVQSATGHGDTIMRPAFFEVKQWNGQNVQLEIVAEDPGGKLPWIWVAGLVQTDRRMEQVRRARDFGSMALSLIGDGAPSAYCALSADTLSKAWKKGVGKPSSNATAKVDEALTGALTASAVLKPGESKTFTFLVSWHFKNQYEWGDVVGRWYANRFSDAADVAGKLAGDYHRLKKETLLWHDTWNDSSLPQWFLDRSFQNICVLATSTARRYENGQFWAWEGVGCCGGTCTHVWQYAQAMARIFPELERNLRERTDYGFALQDDGMIRMRGNFGEAAVDGQAGVILRTYREHQMSADNRFLEALWPKVKKAMDWLIARDDGTGLLGGAQHNTLDSDWYGKIAWLSSLYIAALKAAEEMALEMNDPAYADKCGERWRLGSKSMVRQLFNGKYFINRPDPNHPDSINAGTGCMTDQVMGQGWAFQVGLGRILPETETRTALKTLFNYNFTTDVGPYREKYPKARDFAIAGEPGLIGCTFPDPKWQVKEAAGTGKGIFVGYFHECQSGYEYEAASHMIAEGLLTEGLTVIKAIDARYSPELRNPYNEIECGNYYSRSMAVYGAFLMACGFRYHGPKGFLAFSPKLTPEDFKAAFTATAGWGTLTQKRGGRRQQNSIQVKHGRLEIASLGLEVPEGRSIRSVHLERSGQTVPATFRQNGSQVAITLAERIKIAAGQSLSVEMKG